MADENKPNQSAQKDAKPKNDDSAAKIPAQQEQKPGEAAELKDRLLRLAAEFDNYKKRALEDSKGMKLMGKAEMVKKLLPTLDEFQLAVYALNKEDKVAEGTAKGLELVVSNFISALKEEGLSEIPAVGKYDPYKHEIIMTKDSDKAEGEILDVVRKGYMFSSIMLRPASVIVSNGKPEAEAKKDKNEK